MRNYVQTDDATMETNGITIQIDEIAIEINDPVQWHRFRMASYIASIVLETVIC